LSNLSVTLAYYFKPQNKNSKKVGNRNEMSTEKVVKDLAKQLRNFGPKLAEKLVEARIDSPEKLRRFGAKKAFEK
jgi:hypothetical protein